MKEINNMNDRVLYWIEISQYDLDTAQAMMDTKRYLYVGFMCHQVIEKILKAYWAKVLVEPPVKTHSLSKLIEKTDLEGQMSQDQIDFIDTLEPLNIESRYPSYKQQIAQGLNQNICQNILDKTRDLHLWIKSKL